MGNKIYLGDSVYAEFDAVFAGDIVLTTENGEGPSNTIYLEPSVFAALHKMYETTQLQRHAIED